MVKHSLERPSRWLSLLLVFGSLFALYTLYQSSSQNTLLSKRSVLSAALNTRDFNSAGAVISNTTLYSRADDHTCSASSPCSNGACCGSSGYCGYGPTYCGSGCQSNCGATAECGQYAQIPGTKCPLNTCCSQYGFCGTTTDFCTNNCQSNCVLHPQSPGPAAAVSIVQNRVIGYYESWSARKSCHQVAPENLPLDVLTHVNFAFAYIDPSTLQIVPMDGATPSRLFQDTANIKSIKPSIKVWISVGGWTFSDNGTSTQPLFGAIAADAGKRQMFANNVVSFMRQYGFDGLDIDWEYPGAPDRGGKPQDTQNFVALLKTLHDTFASSGNKYGLTFTAPSSYWYLRWFDLPGMLPYVDWINLMTYDLHGTWDAYNPIGAIVQGHTNLTEIKLATELFWRVNIPPSKIVMGFGFYGRSFTLQDPSCTSPGCAFKGAAVPGPCSAAGGILAYYEIQSVLAARTDIKPIYDSVSAVNYFTYATDQWVSYDDATTFKQKVDWANSVGLGGALIWASDLDDDKYTAHAGLAGRSVASNPTLQTTQKLAASQKSVIQNVAGSNGQNCFAYTGKCVKLDDKAAMQKACGNGYTVVGWDDAGCGTSRCHCGKPICCPNESAPKDCKWRGDNNGPGAFPTDCSAQCFPGETNIKGIKSSWGGGFTNDGNTNKCGRGQKSFCCPNPDARTITDRCYYAKCRTNCKTGYQSIFSLYDNCDFGGQQYCCPQPLELGDCHWNGGSGTFDCADAVCSATEIELARSPVGDGYTKCEWRRQRAMCCTIQKLPPKPASCSADLCRKWPGYCASHTDDESANGWHLKRDLSSYESLRSLGQSYANYTTSLEKRAEKPYDAVLYTGAIVSTAAAAYPAIGELYRGQRASQVLKKTFRLIKGYCTGALVQVLPFTTVSDSTLAGLESEHPIDRQLIKHYIESAAAGLLRGKKQTDQYAIGADFFVKYWNAHIPALTNLGPIGGPTGANPDSVSARVMECFGSYSFPKPFLAVDAMLNGAKGRVMAGFAATGEAEILALAKTAVRLDTPAAVDELMQALRTGFGVFAYINTPEGTSKFNLVRFTVYNELKRIGPLFGYDDRLAAWWILFTDDWFIGVQASAKLWASDAIASAVRPFVEAKLRGINLAQYDSVVATLKVFEETFIPQMTLPTSSSSSNFLFGFGLDPFN